MGVTAIKAEYFVIAKPLLNDTLMLEFFSYVGLPNQDSLLRPEVTYALADALELIPGDFGQYDNNDQIYTKIKYNF